MTIVRLWELTAADQRTDYLSQPASGLPSISTAQVRYGPYSYRFNANAVQFSLPVPTPVSAYRKGYWLYHGAFGASTNGSLYTAANGLSRYESPNILVGMNGTTQEINIKRPQSGTADGYEILATAPMPAAMLATNVWTHYGIVHNIAETDGFLNLYINGVLALAYSGDTRLFGQGSGTPIFATDAAYIWGAGNIAAGVGTISGSSNWLTDMFLDSYVGEIAAPVPARSWGRRTVIGAGTYSEMTPDSGANYTMVDEVPMDGDTTKNTALTTGLRDTYQFSAVTVPVNHTIVAETVLWTGKRLDTETDVQVRLLAYDGVTMVESPDMTPTMDYAPPLAHRFTTKPDGSPWDGSPVEMGVESRGSYA